MVICWLAQPGIGCPPSRNAIEPVGSIGPELLLGSTSAALYVAVLLTLTCEVTASETDVESRPIVIDVGPLVEPSTSEPGPGWYAAEICAVPAPKPAGQITVTVVPPLTGLPVQLPIAPVPLKNVTEPAGLALPELELIVAMSVTV